MHAAYGLRKNIWFAQLCLSMILHMLKYIGKKNLSDVVQRQFGTDTLFDHS
jgi:hypothetical protein